MARRKLCCSFLQRSQALNNKFLGIYASPFQTAPSIIIDIPDEKKTFTFLKNKKSSFEY